MAEQRVIYIVIDPSKARSGASSVVNSLRGIQGATDGVHHRLRATDRAVQNLSRSFNRLQAIFIGLQGFRLFSGFLNELIQADKVVTTFKSQMFTVTGDLNDAADSFEHLKDTAQAYAVPLNSITKGYAKLRASMDFDHLRKYNEALFQSTVILSSVLHMPEYNTERVFNVMIQIMSKGQLMMEELKQQLGEHVPGAITLAAEAMGYTVEVMMDKMQKGLISAEEFASGWSKFIIERFGPAVEISTKSIQASVNRFKNVIQESMIEMSQSESGFAISKLILTIVSRIDGASEHFKVFGQQVAEVALDINDFVKSLTPGDIDRFFKSMIDLVNAFMMFLSFIGRTILFLTEYKDEVKLTAGVVLGSVIAVKAHNAALAIWTASVTTASGAVAALGATVATLLKLLSLAGAGFVGWSIGSWLYEEYDIVKKAGNRIAMAIHVMVETLANTFEMMGLKIKLAFTEPFDYAMSKIASFIRFISSLSAGVLEFMGIDLGGGESLATKLANYLDTGDAGRITDKLKTLREEQESEISKIIDIYDDLFDQIGKGGDGEGSLQDRLGIDEDMLAKYAEMRDLLQAMATNTGEFSSSGDGAADAMDKLRKSIEDIRNELDPLGKEFEDFQKKKDLLHMGVAYKIITPEERDKMIKGLVEAMQEGGEQGGEEFVNRFQEAAERLSDSLSDAIVSGDWGSFGEAIGNTLAGGISSVLSTEVSQMFTDTFGKVTKDSGMFMQLGSAFAGPLAGAIGGALAQVAFNEVADWLSGSNWDPTEERQASQGTGSVLGSIDEKSSSIANSVELVSQTNEELVNINTGMLRALSNLQLGIEGAVAMVARERGDVNFATNDRYSQGQLAAGGFGVAASAAMTSSFGPLSGLAAGLFDAVDDLLGGVLTDGLAFLDNLTGGLLSEIGSGIMGGDQKVIDNGIQIIGGKVSDLVKNTLVQAYATIKEDGGWFSSDKYFDRFQDLATNQFTLVFQGIYDAVSEGAGALGILPATVQDRLDEFVVETQKISLEGLNADEKRAELEAVFSKIFDDMAGTVVPFLEDFQKAGEGLGETLARVATQSRLLEEAITVIGSAFTYYFSAEGLASAADSISQLMGGTEQFASAIVQFEDNFLSRSEKIESMSRRLGDAFGDMELPDTREGFVELVRSQDLITKGGQENFATLLRLQGAANEYYDLLEARAEEINASFDAGLDELISTADNAFSVLSDSINSNIDAARAELQQVERERQQIQDQIDQKSSTVDAIMGDINAIVNTEMDSARERLDVQRETINAEHDMKIEAAEAQYAQQRDAIKQQEQLRLDANRQSIDMAKDVVSNLESEFSSIEAALSGLLGELIPPEMQRNSAISLLENALSTGNMSGTGTAAGTAANIDAAQYGTAVDFAREQGLTANLLQSVQDETGQQLSAAERTLSTLEAQTQVIKSSSDAQIAANKESEELQIASIEEARDQQLLQAEQEFTMEENRLNGILERSQEQIDAVREARDGITNLSEALAQLGTMLAQEEELRKALETGRFEQRTSELEAIITNAEIQLENARSQLEELKGINTGIVSVQAALNSFNAAVNAVQEYQEPEPEYSGLDFSNMDLSGLDLGLNDYSGMNFGLSPDAFEGMDFSNIGSGFGGGGGAYDLGNIGPALGEMDFSGLQNMDFDMSGVEGFASGGSHGGGLRLVGEQGPEIEATGASRITSHSDLMDALGSSKEMLSEMRQLRNEIRDGQRAIAKHTAETAKLQRRWDVTGLPETRSGV